MSKIGKGEWVAVYAVAGTVDVVQWLADFIVGPGEVANELADTVIGCIIAGYFQMRGVSMIKHPSRLASLVGGVLAEMLTVSIAPAWIIDVWYIHHTVVKEESALKEARENQELLRNFSLPLNTEDADGNGVRRPPEDDADDQPSNRNGIRAAGNLQPLQNVKDVGSGIDSVRPSQEA